MHLLKEEQKVEFKERMREGNGTVQIRTFLPKEEACETGRMFGVITLKPGCSIGYHEHQGEFEVFYVVKGTVKITEDGKEYVLHAGDSSQCKSGSSHSAENIGNDDAEIVAVILNVR